MRHSLFRHLFLLAAGALCCLACHTSSTTPLSFYPLVYRWSETTSATLTSAGQETGRLADQQTGGLTDPQTGGLADGQTGGPADRQTGGPADPQTRRPATETYALWPLFSAARARDVSHIGLHPLWSWTNDRPGGVTHLDFLWPLASRRENRQANGTNRSWFVLPLWFSSKREAADGSRADRKTLFPLYYAGTKATPGTPTQSYQILFPVWWRMNHHRLLFPFYWSEPERSFAFFPFYGAFHNLFEIDSIRFILWPLWVTSQRGAVRSYSAPWPFLGVTTRGGASGGRVWPLAGYVHNPREGTRAFYLWPLGQYVTFARGPYKGATLNMFLPLWFKVDHPKRHIAYYFPLYGVSQSDRRVSRAWLWPLFSRTVSTAPSYEKWNVLWFVLSRQKGPDEQRRFYLFNLLGWTNIPGKHVRAHVFWPVLQYRADWRPETGDRRPETGGLRPQAGGTEKQAGDLRLETGGKETEKPTAYSLKPKASTLQPPASILQPPASILQPPAFERLYALPFYYSWTTRWEDGRRDYHRTLWPLATWGRQGSGRWFRALQLLPCKPEDGIGRNWAPFWTLYASSSNPETGVEERRVLGPLYLIRRDHSLDQSEFNLLFFQYSRTGGAKKISLLFGFLPFQVGGERD